MQSSKIFTEYITRVQEMTPGNCIHTKQERIIRCIHCNYMRCNLFDDKWCDLTGQYITDNDFCSKAKQRAVVSKIVKRKTSNDFIDEWYEESEKNES